MSTIKMFTGRDIPLEMHKVRIVQKLPLPPVERRLAAITEAGNNTFLLKNADIYLDMLTDSGVNAMSDNQQAAMLIADDSYAGSATFYRLADSVADVFGTTCFLPAHQGRACENIIAETFVHPGDIIPMNFHFTTTKAHIVNRGGTIVELLCDEGFCVNSDCPFKGNIDLAKLSALIDEVGASKIPFIRFEAGTNFIGGQPFSLANAKAASKLAHDHGILTVLDASLLEDNLYFIKTREPECRNMSIREITLALSQCMDIIYFSARKFGFARGGGMAMHDQKLFDRMMELVPLYEGFLTYGGMSVREMEAVAVGIQETMDEDVISQGPMFIKFMTDELQRLGVPVVTPAGGLGCHINAMEFLPHIPQEQYPAGALAAAVYLSGAIRGMERGTMSEQREPDGSERLSAMELLRLAVPRRVFTMSQILYAVDRIAWLHSHRDMIGGLRFTMEPTTLRFFFGRLEPIGDWQEKLVRQFRADFGEESL